MKFWAIAYRDEEEVWYDLDKKDESYDLKSTCLLPTHEIAQQIIDDELSMQYVPVEIEMETLNKNGTWSWSRGYIETWD